MTPLDYRFSMTADDVKSATECGPATRGLSRRSVVRTAAHAAWAVPVVQLAASAPAFADSTLPGIENPTFQFNRNSANDWTAYSFQVTNDGPGAIPAGHIFFTATTSGPAWTHIATTGNWTLVSGSGTNTIVYRYDAAVPVGTNVPLSGTITAHRANNSGTTSAVVTYVP